MSYIFKKKVISPADLREVYPLSEKDIENKLKRDEEIKKVLNGESDKFLVIIGPCSADNEDSVLDYVSRLVTLQERVADKLIIIPRIYTNKPRTTGEGYKGLVHQPDPGKEPNLSEGLIAMRRLHVRSLKETGLSAADEMLYPENAPYVEDILAYIAIGARSVENQQHRLVSSGLNIPIGMKNPTSGDFSVMLNSVVAAQNKHSFIYRSYEVETTGNEYSHAVLRGAVNKHGQSIPNYHYEDIVLLHDLYRERNLTNPALVVDVNHANSNKDFTQQPRIVNEIMYNRYINPDLKNFIKGVMVESYIAPGNQDPHEHVYGKSITDPCLGWSESEKLIYSIAEKA